MLHRVARDLEEAGVRVLWFSDVAPLHEVLCPVVGTPGASDAGAPGSAGAGLLAALQARVRAERATVVAIDEAQRLEPAELRALRVLAEAPLPGTRLAILLIGQPELEVKLASLAGDDPDRACSLHIRLSRLETPDVRAYMAYRLEQVGLRFDDVFEADAVERVAADSGGIPRLINQLCDAALYVASRAGFKTVSASGIDAAGRWLDLEPPADSLGRGARASVERARQWAAAGGRAAGQWVGARGAEVRAYAGTMPALGRGARASVERARQWAAAGGRAAGQWVGARGAEVRAYAGTMAALGRGARASVERARQWAAAGGRAAGQWVGARGAEVRAYAGTMAALGRGARASVERARQWAAAGGRAAGQWVGARGARVRAYAGTMAALGRGARASVERARQWAAAGGRAAGQWVGARGAEVRAYAGTMPALGRGARASVERAQQWAAAGGRAAGQWVGARGAEVRAYAGTMPAIGRSVREQLRHASRSAAAIGRAKTPWQLRVWTVGVSAVVLFGGVVYLLRHDVSAPPRKVATPTTANTPRSLASEESTTPRVAERPSLSAGAPEQRPDSGRSVPKPPPVPVTPRTVSRRSHGILDAAETGSLIEVRTLLDWGVPTDARDESGMTPLMAAVTHGHEAVVGLLLARGADVNAANDRGVTPLMLAANNDRTALLQTLLSRGAQVNARNRDGWTALTYAAWKGHANMVRRLLAEGGNPSIRDRRGWTPLQYAAWRAAGLTPTKPREPGSQTEDASESREAARLRYTDLIALLEKVTPSR